MPIQLLALSWRPLTACTSALTRHKPPLPALFSLSVHPSCPAVQPHNRATSELTSAPPRHPAPLFFPLSGNLLLVAAACLLAVCCTLPVARHGSHSPLFSSAPARPVTACRCLVTPAANRSRTLRWEGHLGSSELNPLSREREKHAYVKHAAAGSDGGSGSRPTPASAPPPLRRAAPRTRRPPGRPRRAQRGRACRGCCSRGAGSAPRRREATGGRGGKGAEAGGLMVE